MTFVSDMMLFTEIYVDQATYELASPIQKKEPELQNVVLVLCRFHLAFNYLHAICKIIRDAEWEKHKEDLW